ncbi:hypothetical protein Oweho_0927 [Owenweeksia hongkongensis DSM 17368]|uniref:Uncharacterized protein n=1 Tax=Owenweeksia hongkongensis (strain DSM 17368 / CIP 108786 / JCM 12287 / NRRL B-23963 / UST20020801) TaxID=926562 RepID=G8R3B7_OWEHD|nr:hypothetical protein Oweho_0927 [Owenweeksia hongkongensis DSM 17368]
MQFRPLVFETKDTGTVRLPRVVIPLLFVREQILETKFKKKILSKKVCLEQPTNSVGRI